MKKSLLLVLFVIIGLSDTTLIAQASKSDESYSSLEWRNIGPYRGKSHIADDALK